MPDVFSTLNHAIEGTPHVALAAAFAWGMLSLILSPCHLTSIPLIVGFISGQDTPVATRRAFWLSLLFTLGLLITIAVIGIVTAALGRMMGYIGSWVNYAVAVLFFIVGLHLLDVLSIPWAGVNPDIMKRKGFLAAFILGLVFGLALGPCTFAFMAPVLGVSLAVSSTDAVCGMLLLTSYGVGHGSIIVVAGTATGVVQRLVDWNRHTKAIIYLKGLCGILVLFGGLYLIYTAP